MADVPTIKVGQLYGCPKGEGTEFPIAFFEAHREQALRNHYQSLEKLASRGGLGWGEAIAILKDNDNRYTDVAQNREWLRRQFEQWQAANASVGGRRMAETENTGSVPQGTTSAVPSEASADAPPSAPSLQTPQGGDS